MEHRMVIETSLTADNDLFPEVRGTVEVVAELHVEEHKYSMGGPGVCTESYYAIDEVRFEAVLGIGSHAANVDFSKGLNDAYLGDEKLRARVDTLLLNDLDGVKP